MREETTLSQPRQKSRVVAFAVLIFVVIAAAVIYVLFGTSRLDRQLADLRSRGLPTNGEELNAWYAVPSDVRDTTDLWIAATRAIDTSKINKKAVGVPLFAEGLPPIPPPDEEWAELEISRAFLKDLNPEILLFRDAAEAGGMARYPLDFTQSYNAILTDQQQLRTLAMLSSLSGHVHAHDGQTLEVLKDLKSIIAASDSIRGEPILISLLIRIAIHAIGCELAMDLIPHLLCLIEIDRSPYPHSMFRSANKSKAIGLWAESTEGLETSWQEALTRQKKGGRGTQNDVRQFRFSINIQELNQNRALSLTVCQCGN